MDNRTHLHRAVLAGLGFASHEGLDYLQSTLRWLLDNTYPDQKIYYLTPTVKKWYFDQQVRQCGDPEEHGRCSIHHLHTRSADRSEN